MKIVYLDTSAIVKRYIEERGSDAVHKVYESSLRRELHIAFSAWNIGETMVALGKYLSRNYISEQEYRTAKYFFISELTRFSKLKLLKLIPVKTKIITDSIILIEKHRLYVADAIQILSAKEAGSDEFYTADKKLHEAAVSEGLNSRFIG